MLEDGGETRGCLIGYRLPDEVEPIDYAAMPAMFVPLQELENLAPASWYVNVLAVYPQHRGRGHGSRLLSLAEELAATTGAAGLSLIVADANSGARRLYERQGYREAASRPMVKEQWANEGRNWVMLVKSLS
jgi:ribosomal protein S18 acetylase RimI-like enzyme